ncbi:hypothetical protein ACFOY4_05010 [Actinomadura syzygii]|uniref:XRE family transcriptional regulator n=1 Tax=Actinomadura syzygii TaxID=1427538 RepID=A0A5D0TXF3_9ACTN|nr:hypothetical protein [Actinomadura syzygii]TYC10046.1 hypothetical protein FXF65_33680 [Actinomadura syzygii]
MGQATLLAKLAAERHWTPLAATRAFSKVARELGLPTLTVGERTWQRWCAGRLKGEPRPSSCRVLERMFGQPVRELLAPPMLSSRVPAAVPAAPPGEGAYWTHGAEADSDPSQMFEEIAIVADESARFARSVRRIDEHALDQFDADVERFATDYLRRPVYLTFRRIAQLRDEVFGILDNAHHPLDQQRRLYMIAGRLCALLAHANADLGHPREAETHARTAQICVELTGDNSLRAYIRWVQSNISYWRGDFRSAAEIAHAGRGLAQSGSAMLRLTSQESRALAAARDSDFGNAISAAVDARDRVADDDAEIGVFRFSPGKAAYYASEAFCEIASSVDAANRSLYLAQAKQQAHEALDLLSNDPHEQGSELYAAAASDLAAAHLAAQELDGFAEHLAGVLALPPEHRTVPVIRRVNRMSEQLEEYADTPLARDLREQIALFSAHPATAPELPAGG